MYNAILDSLSPFAAALHALAAIIWVGGMFFAYLVLRPTLGHLEGPERLKIWAGVFPKFFGWVWISAIVLLITGYWQIFVDFGGLKGITIAIKLMMGIGILMVFISSICSSALTSSSRKPLPLRIGRRPANALTPSGKSC
jgi:uncharacterized membrane protein